MSLLGISELSTKSGEEEHHMMRNLSGNLNKNGIMAIINASEILGAGEHDSMTIYVWLKVRICKSWLS